MNMPFSSEVSGILIIPGCFYLCLFKFCFSVPRDSILDYVDFKEFLCSLLQVVVKFKRLNNFVGLCV